MKTSKLLLVEDNPILAKSIPSQLTKYGYEVTATVSTGEEAILKAAQSVFDLVLMDIDLGGQIDGFAAMTGIRQHQNIPVIFTTSHSDSEVLRQIKAAGPVTCIRKPFSEKELALAIEYNLYRHQAEAERIGLLKELEEATRILAAISTESSHDEVKRFVAKRRSSE